MLCIYMGIQQKTVIDRGINQSHFNNNNNCHILGRQYAIYYPSWIICIVYVGWHIQGLSFLKNVFTYICIYVDNVMSVYSSVYTSNTLFENCHLLHAKARLTIHILYVLYMMMVYVAQLFIQSQHIQCIQNLIRIIYSLQQCAYNWYGACSSISLIIDNYRT